LLSSTGSAQDCRRVPPTRRLLSDRVQAALRTLGLPANDAYVDEIMRQYDANRDGSVDFGEFRRYVAAKEAAIRAAFAALDVDADGEVSQAELTMAMRRAGCALQGQDLPKLAGVCRSGYP